MTVGSAGGESVDELLRWYRQWRGKSEEVHSARPKAAQTALRADPVRPPECDTELLHANPHAPNRAIAPAAAPQTSPDAPRRGIWAQSSTLQSGPEDGIIYS